MQPEFLTLNKKIMSSSGLTRGTFFKKEIIVKKIFVKVLFCLFIIAGLCSCGNKAKIDENGFFYDLDDAKKVAEKNDLIAFGLKIKEKIYGKINF